jgi:hypothetical protein
MDKKTVLSGMDMKDDQDIPESTNKNSTHEI